MTFARQSASGHRVEWQPEDDELAADAAQAIADNEGVGSIDELHEHNDRLGFDYLPREHYDALREEYRRLHVETYGKDSRYSGDKDA